MRGMRFLVSGFLLIVAAPLAGQQTADLPAAKVGRLEVQQLWTDDADAFIAEWNQPKIPELKTTKRTERNRVITMFIVIRGCFADLEGNCHLTGKLELLDPDGQPYGSVSDGIPVWDGLPAPDPSLLVLSPAAIGLTVEDGEKLGAYRSRLSVTDEIARVTTVTEVTITVTEAPAGD